jgi:hypothetical protein
MLLLTVYTNPSTLFVTRCPISDLNKAIKVSRLVTDPFKTVSLDQTKLCKGYVIVAVIFILWYETTQKVESASE